LTLVKFGAIFIKKLSIIIKLKLKLPYDIFQNVKFIITGSSLLELTGDTSRYLVGRLFSFHLFQFSFGEFLQTQQGSHPYKGRVGKG